MKTSPLRFGRRSLVKTLPSSVVLATALLASLGSSLEAATYTKANSLDALDTTASWVEGVVPTSADIALWNNTVTAANITTAGAGVNFGQIKIANPTGLVTINVDPTLLGGLTLTGVDGVGIDMTTATGNLTINAPLTLAGNQQWNVAAGRTVTIAGATGFNQGASNLTLNGAGTVLFNPTFNTAANTTATGTITVNNGTFDIFSGNTTGFPSLTNILSPLTPLAVGGGTVSSRVGGSVGNFVQNFSSLTINAGATAFTQARGASSTVRLDFGAITRNVGGTVNFAPTTNNSGFRTTSANVNGILSGGITLGGTDFAQAANATTNIAAAVYTNDTWSGTTNTTVIASSSQTDATTNSLRFGAAAALTLTLSGTNTVASGGILNSSGVGAFNNVITGGTLVGAVGGDLVIHQHNTTGSLTIDSVVADNTSATALTKTGAGTVILGGSNTFTGGVYLNAGTLQLGNDGALNSSAPNAVMFGNSSNGILALGGHSVTVSGLTTGFLGAVAPIVRNASATAATLTVNNSIDNTYAGSIQDGAGGGALSLVKQGAGTLNLTGTGLTYGGNTTIAQGKLAVSSNLGGSVTINGGATLDVTKVGAGQVFANGKSLSGSGTVLGAVTLGTGTTANPGGTGTIGNLTVDTLNLNTGSTVNFEFGAAGASDRFTTTTALNIGTYVSGGFNLLALGGGQLTTTGVAYTLFDYTSGSVSGFGNLSSTMILNPVGGLNYTFTSDPVGHQITLTLSGTSAASSNWIQDGPSGNWSAGANWQGGVIPSGASQTANFVATTPNNPAHTVNLDSNRTVGVLKFNSPTAYTISGASTLTLNNGASNAFIAVDGGSHTISTALNLASTLSVAVTNAVDTLTISGVVDGSPAGLIKSGAGTLALMAANTYTGGTLVTDGSVRFSSLASLGTGDITLVGGGGLVYDVGNTADISTRLLTLGAGGGKIDVGANDVTFANSIGNGGDGGLTKAGTGLLTLAVANSYKGVTSVNAGTLSISSNGNLGDETIGGAVQLNGGTLRATTILTLGAGGVNRGIVTNGGAITVDPNMSLTLPGVVSGAGGLILNGPGTVSLANTANTYTGGTQVIGGTLLLGTNENNGRGGIPVNSGTITLNNATLTSNYGAGNTLVYDASNPIVVVGTSTINTPNRFAFNAPVSGTGTLNIAINTTVGRADFQNNFAGFSGQLNLTGTGAVRILINANPAFSAAGMANTALSVDGVFLTPSTNSAPGNTILIGSLSSTGATGGLNGGTAGAATYSVGGLNTSTTYGGVISGNAILTKTGTGAMTLSGANTYTGATNVNGGALVVATTGSLSGSSVLTVANGATLGLDNSISLNEVITLSLESGSTLNLNFAGGEMETIGILALPGQIAPIGTYTVAQLQALDASINFTGTGTLNVTAVPEPGTIALLVGGAGMLLLLGRRRSRVS